MHTLYRLALAAVDLFLAACLLATCWAVLVLLFTL
jgi:hypothetical protein